LALSCPNTSGIVTQIVSGSGSYTVDLGFQCSSSSAFEDFYVLGWTDGFRPGYDRQLNIFAGVNNSYCEPTAVLVTLILDPALSYISTFSGTQPTNVDGNTLEWLVSSMNSLSLLFSSLNIYCDPTTQLGDSICNTLMIEYGVGTDLNEANDNIQVCGSINNSFDPNDKAVAEGIGAEGYIIDGEELHYFIRFQNTGNDTAYNVIVIDTLNENLDVSTFQFLEASHSVNVSFLSNNIINFRFEDIDLVDSIHNEPMSHGFIAYKVKTKTGLAHGTEIRNTAHIYFDFNPAVATNTTLNTISEIFTVTFAGTDVNISSQTIIEGNHATEPAEPTKTDYDFGGWFTDNNTFLNAWNFANDVVTQDTTLYVKWVPSSGIENIKFVNGIKIYPNPSEGIFTVSSSEQINSIVVFDNIGRVVMSLENLNTTEYLVNLSTFSKGMYTLQLISDDYNLLKKVVVR
jgi:uncharacterized repeat protein (TIGR01451 family)/uncharacterized repeat protein (TIGR02543 family)